MPRQLRRRHDIFMRLHVGCGTSMSRRSRFAAFVGAAALAMLGAGCTRSSPVEPSAPSQPPRTTATCPAPVTANSVAGQPVPVTFDDPQVAGGRQPLSVSCSPASGTAFGVGTTTVACTITDASEQAFTCSFTVPVVGPPRLSTSTVLAFGDSLTGGSTPPDPIDAYPPRLRSKLAARYLSQSIVVIPAFNDSIRTFAQREGATLVDIYTAMGRRAKT